MHLHLLYHLLYLDMIVLKTLILTVLWLLYEFLPLTNNVNVPKKRNRHKN
jgi:hypothetical protein